MAVLNPSLCLRIKKQNFFLLENAFCTKKMGVCLTGLHFQLTFFISVSQLVASLSYCHPNQKPGSHLDFFLS